MKPYKEMNKEELMLLKEEIEKKFEEAKSKGLKLDMSRGKQSTAQLDMTMSIMDVFNSDSILKTEASGRYDGSAGTECTCIWKFQFERYV